MIQIQTKLTINDNSGIKIGQCIKIYKKRVGKIGAPRSPPRTAPSTSTPTRSRRSSTGGLDDERQQRESRSIRRPGVQAHPRRRRRDRRGRHGHAGAPVDPARRLG